MPVMTHPVEEKTAIEKAKRSFRLARFVAVLALDSERLQGFIEEPEEEMAAAGLTPKEKGYLTNKNFKDLCDYLWKVGDKPTPPDEEPPSTGSG